MGKVVEFTYGIYSRANTVVGRTNSVYSETSEVDETSVVGSVEGKDVKQG